VFGAMLLFFVLFARGGIIELVRSWLPNWNGRLHGAQGSSEQLGGARTPAVETVS
jgi:hypothetical protein